MVLLRCLFVKNTDNKTNTIHNVESSIRVSEFKRFVADKTGVEAEKQFLVAGTKPLRDDRTLEDYNIHENQTFTMIVRLPGGASAEGEGVVTATEDNDNDAAYKSLTLNKNVGFGVAVKTTCEVCYNDDIDDWRFKLPCNHIICACSLKNQIKKTATSYGLEILCPMTGCGQKMEYNDISPYARMLEEEQKTWEEKLGKAVIQASTNMCICPHCTGYLLKEYREAKVQCILCNGTPFCFVCLNNWVSRGNTVCGNDGCGGPNAHKINALENCATKQIGNIPNIPEIRICPNCELLINHGEACKHMTCPRENGGCGYEFCFSCLKKWDVECNNGITCTPHPTQIPQRT